MDYAQNAANQAYGNVGSVGQLKNVQDMPPRTISSAAARIDELNARLAKATESLSMISSQIGALSPVGGGGKLNTMNGATEPSGAVYRLNNSADQAHVAISEIENLIGGIARALG